MRVSRAQVESSKLCKLPHPLASSKLNSPKKAF